VSSGDTGDWIGMPFGVVSGMGPGIHVLDGSPRASRGRSCFWHSFWHFSKNRFHWFQWRHGVLIMVLIDFRLVCEKLTIFPYAEYIVAFCVRVAFLWYSQVQDRSQVDAKFMCKDVTLNTRELPAAAGQRQPIAVAIFDDLHICTQRR